MGLQPAGSDSTTMKLDLRFAEVKLENLWCEAVAALVFQEPFCSQETISSLETSIGGYLGTLNKSGFFRGSLDTTLLLASEGRIKADKLILKGLGPRADCSPDTFMRCVAELGDSLAKLGIRDMAVWIPFLDNFEKDPAPFFCDACMTLIRPYEKASGRNTDFSLKAVFSIPKELLRSPEDIVRIMKEKLGHPESCSVVAVGRGPHYETTPSVKP